MSTDHAGKTLSGIPRPEHPKPQLMRENWDNLNGLWDFAFDMSQSGLEDEFWKQGVFPHQILVPFCPESKLSGIGFTDFIPAVWYRRRVQISRERMDGRVILHFGAVDFECRVWVNDREAGCHRGGYCSFSFDISALVTEGENTIVVYAADDPRSGKQSCGKQSLRRASHGCFYTRTTGIWQTVWLEYVPKAYLKGLRVVPDVFNGSVHITAALVEGDEGRLTFTLLEEGRPAVRQEVRSMGQTAQCSLTLQSPRPWSPDSPFLYDLEIELEKNGIKDIVHSYVGLRSVEWKNHKFYLNGKPLFQRLVLDQGFYPTGIYTAPDDAALVRDIRLSKELGFNGARLHEKVFEERFLYHADRLGYLVWGEYGNWGLDITVAEGLEIFLPEWMETMARDFNHPAIIGWCPFNETFDMPVNAPRRRQDDEVIKNVYHVTKALDPTRPVIDTSGFYHVETDIYDLHDYEQYPAVFMERYGHGKPGDPCFDEAARDGRQCYDGTQPLFMSEYGGTFWIQDEEARATMHAQQDVGWRKWENPKSEEDVCLRYEGLTTVLLKSKAFCGFCYTQLTDVEQETNGLYTYDRQKKFSDEMYRRIAAANGQAAAIEQDG